MRCINFSGIQTTDHLTNEKWDVKPSYYKSNDDEYGYIFRENGYPTTEAEKVAADARQRQLERAMAEQLLKDIKITKKGG